MDSNTPFPQADDLNKVLKLISEFDYKTKNELMEILQFSAERQMSYYKNACLYLGFMIKDKSKYKLSKVGLIIANENKKYRKLRFIQELLKNEMILESYLFLLKEKISNDKLLEIIRRYDNFDLLSESTQLRRISTIRRWIKWIIKNI